MNVKNEETMGVMVKTVLKTNASILRAIADSLLACILNYINPQSQ